MSSRTAYIWQKKWWPRFDHDIGRMQPILGSVRLHQGRLLGKIPFTDRGHQAEMLVEDAMHTSAIEGVMLDRESVRSSVARKLGLEQAGLAQVHRDVDGLVEMLVDATRRHDQPLTTERIQGWQAALFPTGFSGMHRIDVGRWRSGPVRVVPSSPSRERIHFEAPEAERVPEEMDAFLRWWDREQRDGILRAGLAHLWFVTIHPFDDGNGRVARAITDMALAQDEGREHRLYSMSSQILEERADYYEILERTQRGGRDVTDWLSWFLGCLQRAIVRAEKRVDVVVAKALFWQHHADDVLNARQIKVVNRMLDEGEGGFEGGLTNRKYVSMTRISRETAARDISDLVTRGILKRTVGRGRNVSYEIAWSRDEGG